MDFSESQPPTKAWTWSHPSEAGADQDRAVLELTCRCSTGLGEVLKVPWISFRHPQVPGEAPAEQERRLGIPGSSSSPRDPWAVHSCSWCWLGLQSRGVSASEHLWDSGLVGKLNMNPTQSSAICHAESGPDSRLETFSSYFLCLYDSSISLFWNLLKEKARIQRETGFKMLALKLVISQKPNWNLQCGLPHGEQVKTWFGAVWQWLSAPNSSVKKKILLPTNSVHIQLEWKYNRKLDGLKSTCFSFSLVA